MELIPGLPNELAMDILLRLPSHSHPQAMEVSSLWKIVLCSDRFYMLRRLRSPFPSLLLLFKGLHSHEQQMYQILELDAMNPSLFAPRLLASSQAGPLSNIPFPHLGFDFCVSLNSSLLLLNTRGDGEATQFDMLSRQWTPFGPEKLLPLHLAVVDSVYFLGLLDSCILLLVSIVGTSHKVALSYNYAAHGWVMHHGLPQPFFLDRMRLTFRGQLFVRNNADPPIVYVFDPSTKSWKAHAQMTERLLGVSPWSRVVATSDGTLMCVIHSSPGTLEVLQQNEGQTNWSSQLEIATGGRIRVEFYLFIQDEHILLVTEGPRDVTHAIRCQEYVVGQRRLTCIFVPYCVLMGAVLIGD